MKPSETIGEKHFIHGPDKPEPPITIWQIETNGIKRRITESLAQLMKLIKNPDYYVVDHE